MKAEITTFQLYWNRSLLDFFFRDQASRTLEELFKHASCDSLQVADIIDDYVYINDIDVDTFEEMCYDMSVKELAEEIGIELEGYEEEENDDDEDEEEE